MFDDFLLGYPPERHERTVGEEEQEPWSGDDLDCPQCGAMLELVEGGMFECPLCAFSDNDPAGEESTEEAQT